MAKQFELLQYIQSFVFLHLIKSYKLMKRSLAPPRRDKPAGNTNTSVKKLPGKAPEDRGTSNEKVSVAQLDTESHDKMISQKFEERYRNKNLNVLPTPLLVALSTLSTLDISYNKLTDSQIELIMNSCTKLSTLCIQGNLTNLIPASISKLKLLINFRHDWVKLSLQQMYEPEKRLEKIKQVAKKPDIVTKINRIVGLDFGGYCQAVLQISMDKYLLDRIEKSDCSTYAKQNMLKYMEDLSKGKIKQKQKPVTINEGDERSKIPACFANVFGMDDQGARRKQQKWNQMPHRREGIKQAPSQAETDAASTNIKIQDIRDITEKESLTSISDFGHESMPYVSPGMPLHQLFSTFDRNPHAPAQIDGLLLRSYNPNQYDQNGLSPYHVAIIQRQKKGLEYLLEISSNNPGFFDLQMPSVKEGRNILHFSVFLKNYTFTKMLIDFGLPLDKRDATGARLLHLVDQNYEFLILLRKLLRKRTNVARNLSALSVPPIPHQNKKNYVKHPQRQKEQSRLRITYSRNDKLLQMYEAATGIPGTRA